MRLIICFFGFRTFLKNAACGTDDGRSLGLGNGVYQAGKNGKTRITDGVFIAVKMGEDVENAG